MSDTKERILEISLELFSKQGYTAVSVRDICKQVGIKESSVYYHFQNKQSIFNELLNRFSEVATEMMQQLENGLADCEGQFSDGFNVVADVFFERYLMDGFCNKVIRMMLIEQFCNDEVRKLYQYWLIDAPLSYQSKIFSALINLGMINAGDCEYIAAKYYSAVYLYAHKWLFCGELTEEKKAAFRAEAYKYTQKFFAETGEK